MVSKNAKMMDSEISTGSQGGYEVNYYYNCK